MGSLILEGGLDFAAGLLSFFAPCVLSLIPVYLGFLTGTNLHGGEPPGMVAVLRQALAFVLGFSLIFVVLGAAAGALGGLLYDALPVLRQIGGALLVILGFHLIGWLRLPALYRERRFRLGPGRRTGATAAFVVGLVFAAGWTPCVGPVLAGILTLVADGGDPARGGLLMAAYAAGFAAPFLAAALAVESVAARIRRLGPHLGKVSGVSGAFVAALGLLLFFDLVDRLSADPNFWTPPI